MSHHRFAILGMVAFLALSAGCGGDGGGAADSGSPNRSVFLVQKSAEASNSISAILEAANQGILAANPNSGSPAPGPHPVPVFPGATPAFDFAAAVDETFDFDAVDADGNDLNPDVSGQIHVTATGTETGDPSAGTATYAATVDIDADVVSTNPETGVITTIPAGATWSYLLFVEWTMTDSENWEVTATATTTIDVQGVTVDDAGVIVTVGVVGDREVISSRERVDKKPSHSRSFSGSVTSSVDDGTVVEDVIFEFTKPGHVTISVLSTQIGPLSEGQVQHLFNTVIN
jgi:hypothetical protein